MSEHTPLILIELVLVFGGVLAFAWWQFRDVKRAQEQAAEERRAREALELRGAPAPQAGHGAEQRGPEEREQAGL